MTNVTVEDKSKEKKEVKYETVIPKGSYDYKFNRPIKDEDGNIIGHEIIADCKLITDLDKLKTFAETCKDKKVAVDTETTGLTYLKDKIVGFSVSLDAYSGIYVPIRHQHKKTIKVKEYKYDKEGNPVLTKTGKHSQHTVEYYEFSEYEKNLDPKEALDVLYEIMLNAKVTLMHNSMFDMNMIKQEGYDVLKCTTFDTMLLPYIYDPEARLNGLKPLTKHLLGRYIQDFSDATGGEKLFQYTNPEESYVYAACDSANCYGIYEKLYKPVKELLAEPKEVLNFNGKRYNVLQADNRLLRAFVDYYGHAKLRVDRQAAIAYRDLIDKETKDTVEKIYSFFGIGPFSLSVGSKEFQNTMKRFHMETGAKTKKGNRTSYGKDGIKEMNKNLRILKEEIWPLFRKIPFVDSKLQINNKQRKLPASLEAQIKKLMNILETYGKPYFSIPVKGSVNVMVVRNLNGKLIDKAEFGATLLRMYAEERKKLKVLQLILRYSSLMKALNSYVTKLTEVDECVMNYRLMGTKSCRFSSGNGSKNAKDKNEYYIDLNAQNLTKPEPCFYEATKDYGEKNILGWTFKPVSDEYAHEHSQDKDKWIVEGTSQTANIRACLIAPEGRLVVSCDYSSQEALALAELSGDSLMISNFKNGIDPHEATAVAVWGRENYDKFKRRKAKQANFLLNYGGQEFTLSKNMEISLAEAKEIVDKYYQAYWELAEWKQNEVDKMEGKNKGKVFTRFGRPRQLLPWLKAASKIGDEGLKRYAERSVCSHQVQGLCGDICRRDFLLMYKKWFKGRNPHIDFISSVHDEINVAITNDEAILIEYIRDMQEIMDFPYINPTLPIKTSIEIGYSLGTCFPFVWTDETKTGLIPKRIH